MREDFVVIPTTDNVLFPGEVLSITIDKALHSHKCALDSARMRGGSLVISWARKNENDVCAPSEVACLARLRILNELPDGKMEFVVLGEKRVKIIEWTQEVPFLSAVCEILDMDEMPSASRDERRQIFLLALARLIFFGSDAAKTAIRMLRAIKNRSLDGLCNFAAHYIVQDPAEKQTYLENSNLDEKSSALLNCVQKNLESIEHHIKLLRCNSSQDKTSN